MLALEEQCMPRHAMAALRSAQPLDNVAVFRNMGGLWRRYDRMRDFPAGLLVIGDALCSLNPIYGQGMTMAALEALTLQGYLRDGAAKPLEFFRAAAKHIGPVWAMNQSRDRVPSAEERRSLRARLTTSAMNYALKTAQHDIVLTERFFRVSHLVDPPSRLQDPALIGRVVLAGRRRRLRSSMRRSWCTTVRLARRRVVRAVAR
jgi:2-polyprenyl-6-methoxyphenol hydroxylase-like FAD-dependent oxidoreductase